jgi:hypothetical protein
LARAVDRTTRKRCQNPGQPMPSWMTDQSPARRTRKAALKPRAIAAPAKINFREIFPAMPPPSYGVKLTPITKPAPAVRRVTPAVRRIRPAVRPLPSWAFGLLEAVALFGWLFC